MQSTTTVNLPPLPDSGYFDCRCCEDNDITSDVSTATICDSCRAIGCDESGDSPECRDCFVDDHFGVYCPQIAIERLSVMRLETRATLDAESVASILAGPDSEFYWESWDEITSSPVGTIKEGFRHFEVYLEPDGDVFLRYYLIDTPE